MDREFWIEKWKSKAIGFHYDGVNPVLENFYKEMKLQAGDKVFIPLCGKSGDIFWLMQKEVEVVGVELSEMAIVEFFTERKLDYQVKDQNDFKIYKSNNLTIYCGDLFNLTSIYSEKFDAVYDRAAFVAMPKNMRNDYLMAIKKFVSVNSRILLQTLSYGSSEFQGPPFSVNINEYESVLEKTFTLMDESIDQKMSERLNTKCLAGVYLAN